MRYMKSALLITIASILAVVFIMPLLWMVSISFKDDIEAILPNLNVIPDNPTFANYSNVLTGGELNVPILRWIFNSLFVGIVTTILVVTIDALAAYGLARLDIPFRKTIFSIIVSTMMIPSIVWFLPLYAEFNSLGLIDTYWALILPYTAGAFGVFLLYQFFSSFPKEIEEAAYLDGANKFQIFYRILLPSAKPALWTLAILTFMGVFNDFVWPLYATNSDEMRTLTAGIAIMTQGSYVNMPNKLMALSTIATIPVMVIFLIGQKSFVKAVTQAGIK
ncbi:UNVERIFIED_ORG: multiple sugar transport system permease protein [Anoxybacillus amylolyticus]|uniref:ABC transporter permease n=1 Tax=Geobacillus thermopakistaniensis (strain MAS1) TaxID=1408282 RepID=A0A7U9P6X8_GEOTM|nr:MULTISPECIES: carbohydrate ABC transporter permease [unclassified Geobacillus]ADI26380.1 binding-protein-dependent transport systems inner membrane component [Geobacillus sp. C56-T3]ESU72074.1 ABC transporter permease [Geobacillus sp. MAS1]